MPTDLPVASIEEVLDFCNKVREAGGANPLDALMPAVPQDSKHCLIARNLNFSCSVRSLAQAGFDSRYEDDEIKWYMVVEDDEVRHRIATSLDLPLEVKLRIEEDSTGTYNRTEVEAILLPREIGRAAGAFDRWFASNQSITRWLLHGGGHYELDETALLAFKASPYYPYIEDELRAAIRQDIKIRTQCEVDV